MENSIANNLQAVAQSWELYKSYNDRLVNEITTKGAADPLTLGAIERLNDELDGRNIKCNRPKIAPLEPRASESEYKAAFCDYIRKGYDNNLRGIEVKTLSAGSDRDGGYLVTPRVSQMVTQNLVEESLLRSLARVIEVSTDAFEYVEDKENLTYGWVEESDPRPETKGLELKKRSILVHEIYTQPKATQKLLDDASIDIETWLADKVASSFSIAENQVFLHGDGKGKPRGILNYENSNEAGKIEVLTRSSVTAEGLLDLIYSMPEQYANNATMLMNRSVVHQIRTLKCPSTGQYLWQPALNEGQVSSIFGLKVIESADMPVLSEGAKAIVLADFKEAYTIVDRAGIRILRDPFTDKPFVKFYSTKRVGGDVVNSAAIKLYKLA